MQWTSAAEAVRALKSGDRVFIHTAAAAPPATGARAHRARAPELRGVEVVHLHTEGGAPYAAPDLAASFHPDHRAALEEQAYQRFNRLP